MELKTTFPKQLKSFHSRASERVAIYLQFPGRDDLPLTYDQLLCGASAYARTLEQEQIQPGEVVVLILQHGEDLVYSFWGAILHGAIPSIMPFLTEKLSPERYRADLAALVSVTKPAAIVTYPEFEVEVRAALQEGDSVRSVVVTDRIEAQVDIDFGTLKGFQRKPEDIVLLQHSSGTTGLQKGVALSHQAVFNQLSSYGKSLSVTEKDVIVTWLPLYHDMGLIAGFLMPILAGIPLVIMSPFDWVRAPYRLLQSISKYRGTLTWLPNFAYNFCAQKIRDRHIEGVDLSSLHAVINCSEPVRWESHMAFYERFKEYGLKLDALQTSYAMAENVFGVTQSRLGSIPAVEEIDREAFMVERVARGASHGHPAMKMMSSGQPLENVKVKVVDESGNEVPERVIGEVALQSDCMLTGYFNRPDLTEKAFRDGWYLTGDYGYLSKGELFVSGRKKDMIIVGGRNIYPQDLESLTYEVPGVHAGRSVAFGMFDEMQGTEEAVIIAEVDSEDLDEQQKIADAIRLHVTKNSAIALRYVKVVGPKWILKTSSGKTARSANKEKFLQELQEDQGVQEIQGMSSVEALQWAIQAARAGRRMEAREALLKIVDVDPRNEMAWMWLSGLVDSLEDRMIACENVLTINPANEKVRAYLTELHRQNKSLLAKRNLEDAVSLFNRARAHADQNETDSALRLATQALEKHENYEEAWLLIGRLSPDFDQRLTALEKAHKLNPSNAETASALKQVRYLRANPISAAAQLEQLGKFEEALKVYHELAAKTKNSREFDHIYKQIIRIEGLRKENIRYVAPASSIARLSFAWPLLYFSLAMVQMGLNPFAHPEFYLWLGLPLVGVGSFLLSLAEIRSNHIVWQKLFYEQGDGSAFARSVTAATGWFLVIIPHVLLLLDSLNRLRNFKIPPMPF